MQKTSFQTKLSFSRLAAPLTLAALIGVVAIGCGETDDPSSPWNGSNSPIGASPGGTTAGGLTAGGGGTTGGGQVTPPATGGGQVTPPATGGGGQVTPPATGGGGATAGGAGADTLWCKVKAISDAKCVACHTTPAVAGAPFPLKTFADFTAAHPSKPGKKIWERVGVRVHADKSQTEGLTVMPPGAQLPADQLAVIDSWIAAGAPQGNNPTCAGAAPAPGTPGGTAPTVEWPPKECDAVYKITAHGTGGVDTPYTVQPKQEIHPQISWPAPWGSESVQAIGFKTITDNESVLHHWILYGANRAFLTGWAPGEDGIKMMGPDIGMQMPPGNLNLDVHYNSLQQTSAQTDKSGLEICVVKKAKFRKNTAAVTMGLSSIAISIPPNSKGTQIKASYPYNGTTPVTLLSASPHAHTYARRMIFTVKKKNGQTITMHDMPFVFGDQKSFPLNPPVVVEAGDTITTTCIYDNDTSKTVTFGEDTGNEMCFNFALYYPAGALSGILGGLGGAGGFFGGAAP
jgi:hypothetical protein